MRKKIVLTGGGSAGHVVPHLALLPYLAEFDKFYIGSHGGIEKGIIARETNIRYFSVTTVKLRRSFDLRNLTIPFKILKGVAEAKRILGEIMPDIVFSKGGFVAYPVVRAAAKLEIPVVAHESDMSMGLANRLCARYCKVVCTTFKATGERGQGANFVHTGSPIRDKIFEGNSCEVERRHGLTEQRRRLLVVGGSLGAAKINEAVRAALSQLLRKYYVIHICGKGKMVGTRQSGYIELEFVSDIENYYAWADVVISRAGSGALCELAALCKPALFIPLATGRGDQIENAREVLRTGAAAVLWEEELCPARLIERVDRVYLDREKYQKSKGLGEIYGTRKIADIIKASQKF